MLDSRAWINTFSVPLGLLLNSVLGDGEEREDPGPISREGEDARRINPSDTDSTSGDPDARRRERRAAKPYGWMRKVQGRQYNVVNLDVADKDQYRKNLNTLKRSFSGNM